MKIVTSVTGAVLVTIGSLLVFRPDFTAQYRDVLAPSTPVSDAFGVAVSRLNGVLLALLGLWLLWVSLS